MSESLRPERRAFLATAAGLAAACSLPGFVRAADAGADPFVDPTVRAMCDAAGYDRRAASRIAEAYWESSTGGRDAGILLDRLRSCTSIDLSATGSPEQIRDRVRRRIRGDFAEGRTITVDGWVLSETELRLCEVTALLMG